MHVADSAGSEVGRVRRVWDLVLAFLAFEVVMLGIIFGAIKLAYLTGVWP